MSAYEKFPEPRLMDVVSVTPNKKEIGVAFKKDQKVNERLRRKDGRADGRTGGVAVCVGVEIWGRKRGGGVR